MTKKEKKDDSPRNNDDSLKELYERQNNEMVRRMLDTKEIEVEEKVGHEREKVNNGRKNSYGNLTEKANSDSVVKAKEGIVKEVVNRKDRKCNSFKEKIDERLELIERSIIDTQNDSLTELTKKNENFKYTFTDRQKKRQQF